MHAPVVVMVATLAACLAVCMATAAPSTALLYVQLREHNLDVVRAAFAAVSDPNHVDYGRHWTVSDLARVAGATDAELATVRSWLHGLGAVNIVVAPCRSVVTAVVDAGTAADLTAAAYQHTGPSVVSFAWTTARVGAALTTTTTVASSGGHKRMMTRRERLRLAAEMARNGSLGDDEYVFLLYLNCWGNLTRQPCVPAAFLFDVILFISCLS